MSRARKGTSAAAFWAGYSSGPSRDRGFDAGTAVNIVCDRIRASTEYQLARSYVEAAVYRLARANCTDDAAGVRRMRMLGGFTAMVEREINSLPAWASENRGSPMFPYSVRDVLRREVPALREAVQARVASALRADAHGARS